MTNLFEVACERIERDMKKPDMVESIADCLVQDHISLMNEIEVLHQQLSAAKEEITLDEQRVADLMSQVGELSEQISSRDVEITELKVVSDHNLATYHQAAELLRAERDKLREHVTLLRDALLTLRGKALYLDFQFDTGAVDEALAATEPKP